MGIVLINSTSTTFLYSSTLSFTKSIGAEVDRNSKGMGIRSSRYAMIIENMKVLNIQEEEETKKTTIYHVPGSQINSGSLKNKYFTRL